MYFSFQVDPLSPGSTMPPAAGSASTAHPAASANNSNKKKSLASRISNQFERFKRSSSADKSQSRVINVHHHQENFSPHFRPRRTFYNVMPTGAHGGRRSMRGPSGGSQRRYYHHPPVSASVTPSWLNSKNDPASPAMPHYVHR